MVFAAKPRARRYGIALLAAVLALALRKALDPLLGNALPYFTVWAAVVFSSWYCGLVPSILTTLVSCLGVWWFFLPHLHSVIVRGFKLEVTGIACFLCLSGFIVALGETNRRSIAKRMIAETELRSAHARLEQTVEDRTSELAASVNNLVAEVRTRQAAEQGLRDLSARLIRLQDEERRRVARDLHDSTGQTLVAVKLALAELSYLVGGMAGAQSLLKNLEALADEALKDIRTTSHLLHPPMLDEVGFASAARWYVDGFSTRSGIETTLEISPLPMSKDCELVLFRVLQESLTNVVRHSDSKLAGVRLYSDSPNAMLTVTDFGRGFPPEKLKAFAETGGGVGVGLGGMKERLHEVGGRLLLENNCNGAVVIAMVPLRAEAAGSDLSKQAVSSA